MEASISTEKSLKMLRSITYLLFSGFHVSEKRYIALLNI